MGVAPLSASLSWQEYSLTRSYLMIIPLLTISGYGIYQFVCSVKNQKIRAFVASGVVVGIFFFVFFSWNFYLNHYPKREATTSAWQCGYSGVGSYIKENYNAFDRFYISKKLGQPYIYVLFYLGFPPQEYQKEASLTELDEYGFGQVERFDKFRFSFENPDRFESAVFIGFPDEFPEDVSRDNVIPIEVGKRDVFWIFEGQRNR
jgi:hypothetical protein